MIPSDRLQVVREQPPDLDGDYVLYWMRATRRADHNYALDRAIHWAKELGRPLVVLEALRSDYRWASDRHHAFVIDGMRDNQRAFERSSILYHPYVEPAHGRGRGLLAALGRNAAVVVTDDNPSFHFPHMLAAAAEQLRVRLEAIDSNGLLPLRAAGKAFVGAYPFRRFLQKQLPRHLGAFPRRDPLRGLALPQLAALPAAIAKKWPATDLARTNAQLVAKLPIDHTVGIVDLPGGARSGAACVKRIDFDRYDEARNQPDEGGTGLSPYLHFGHVSPHAVLETIAARYEWSPADLSEQTSGAREGWWNLPAGAESFLDELVTWRELGFVDAAWRDDVERFDSLPAWALRTLAAHAGDERPELYGKHELEEARTYDELWNAAQRQLVREGKIHNYLRMLWGKKVLQWSESPRQAADVLIELNNRWALDGRDPNSYSGIYWCFGRYDRAWGPERAIFGTVRYMSSESTRRKLRVKGYLARYAEEVT